MPERPPPATAVVTANDRFKRRSIVVSSNALILAVGIHFAAFALFPRMTAADINVVGPEDLEIIPPPKAPDIPEAPQRIQRPAAPVISEVVVDEQVLPPTDPRQWSREELLRPPAPRARDDSAVPFTAPMTVRPRLLNEREVARALERGYPALLREAGIGGTTLVWFFLDEDGRVLRTQVNATSGYDALDRAALEVAAIMRFSPAMNRNDRVRVWVSVPIRFEVRTPQS